MSGLELTVLLKLATGVGAKGIARDVRKIPSGLADGEVVTKESLSERTLTDEGKNEDPAHRLHLVDVALKRPAVEIQQSQRMLKEPMDRTDNVNVFDEAAKGKDLTMGTTQRATDRKPLGISDTMKNVKTIFRKAAQCF